MSRPPAPRLPQGEVVEAVNFNAPGQVVIAGTASAVARAIEAATRARRAARAAAADQRTGAQLAHGAGGRASCASASRASRWRPPAGIAVYGVDVKTHRTPADIRAALVKQLHTPVYWAATVRTMIAAGATHIDRMRSGQGADVA